MSFHLSRFRWRPCARALAVAMPCLLLALAGRSGSAAIPAAHDPGVFAPPALQGQRAALALPPRAWSVVDILAAYDAARAPDIAAVPLPPARPRRAAPATEPARAAAQPRPVDYGVFASVAVPMGGLPMQPVFRKLLPRDAASARAALDDWRAWRRIEKGAGKTVEPALLGYVNREVNLAIAYRSDKAAHGKPDHWASPDEIARRGAGDCEDFALAKMWVLAALGVAAERMQLVVLEDKRRGLYHAVLAVHLDEGAYILDNVTDRLRADGAVKGYHPLYSFAGEGGYIHGFRTRSASAPAGQPALGTVYPGLGAE